MSILFYVIRRDDNKSRTNFYKFILDFSKQVNERLIVIDENAPPALALHPLVSDENISIVDIDEALNGWVSQSEEKHTPRFYNYLNDVEKVTADQFKERNSARAQKLYPIFRDIVVKYDVRAAHLCVFFGAFRPIGAAVLQDVMTAKKIPLYMIHKTKVKGRFCVYTNIYFGLKDGASCYNDTLRC